jgi:hypothetical protein
MAMSWYRLAKPPRQRIVVRSPAPNSQPMPLSDFALVLAWVALWCAAPWLLSL